jgi:hypothetical protein
MEYIYKKVNLKKNAEALTELIDDLESIKKSNNPKSLCTHRDCWCYLTAYQKNNHQNHKNYIVQPPNFALYRI